MDSKSKNTLCGGTGLPVGCCAAQIFVDIYTAPFALLIYRLGKGMPVCELQGNVYMENSRRKKDGSSASG